MMFWQIGLAGMIVLTLVLTGAILILGPQAFAGYLIYLIGWLMVANGIPVLWTFKLNTTYAFAIYPIAFILQGIFWKFFFNPLNRVSGGNPRVDNIISRILLFIPISLICMGMWFATGNFLMWFAEKNTGINASIFELGNTFAHENAGTFFIAMTIFTVLVYIVLILTIMGKLWRRSSKLEEAVK